MSGVLYGVSVGPGDPELITLKAARILASADVIAYPRGASGTTLALSIAARHVPETAQHLAFTVPMESDRAPAMAAYDEAARAIAEKLDQGLKVACLCEGDGFFYGSFMYLYQRLAERYTIEVIPGISSLTATASVAGVPIAARNEVLSVIPAPLPADTLKARLELCDSALIIKLGRHFTKVYEIVEALGLKERAVLVEAATRADQKVSRLSAVSADERPYFSSLLIYKGAEPWL